MSTHEKPLVGVVMGSNSDWEVMKNACQQLNDLGIAYEAKVVSAHRTPDLLYQYARRGVCAFRNGYASDFVSC